MKEAVELVKASYLSGGEREVSFGDELGTVVLLMGGKVIKDIVWLSTPRGVVVVSSLCNTGCIYISSGNNNM